jgi:tRNA A-37 threonylcarbamoyl transferase component Bud32
MLSYPSVPNVPTLRIATDADGIAALKKLVDILATLAHPSVISVETTRFEKTSAEVVLTEVNGTSLASGMELESLVKATAAAAAAIAHVHDHRIALHTINADSFIVRKDLSVVLCGFDDATTDASDDARKTDLRVFAEYATSCVPAADPIRDRINNVEPSALRDSFVRILEQAAKGDIDPRTLAEKLRHALWFDNATATPKIGRKRDFHPSRRTGIIAAVVFIALAIVASTRLQSNASPTQPSPVPSCQLRTGSTVDVDNDGCPDTVAFNNGVVIINNERYAVGEPTDEVAIGNWSCNDKITLALLRPSTGEVFVFDEWPAAGKDAQPRTLQTGSPTTGLHAIHNDDCDAIGVANGTFDARKAQ